MRPLLALITPLSEARPDNSLPGQPPGYWGGGNVPMPTPPIHMPPGVWPPPVVGGGPVYPPGIWGPTDPRPTPPIVIPPENVPPEIEVPPNKSLVIIYIPGKGYEVVLIDTPPGGNTKPPAEGGAQPK